MVAKLHNFAEKVIMIFSHILIFPQLFYPVFFIIKNKIPLVFRRKTYFFSEKRNLKNVFYFFAALMSICANWKFDHEYP